MKKGTCKSGSVHQLYPFPSHEKPMLETHNDWSEFETGPPDRQDNWGGKIARACQIHTNPKTSPAKALS